MKPKSTLVQLVPKLKKEAHAVLQSALKQDYDTVIVFGFKDGDKQTLSTSASIATSKLEIIGALEVAKQHIWNIE